MWESARFFRYARKDRKSTSFARSGTKSGLTRPTLLQNAVRERRRVVAVGTTTTRTLEFLMLKWGRIQPGAGYTDIYVLPGFEFRVVGGLLTNFHLPRSTLLMLVAAYCGRQTILKAYGHAVEAGYRFYSYGDCMLIF